MFTGFPTVKKKKKKSLFPEITTPQTDQPPTNTCDRVPKEGEEYTKFVQRTEKAELPNSKPTVEKSKTPLPEECSAKWEMMSECESLPQDERIDFDEDLKPERMTLRQRDLSPATSVDTRISERSKTKGDDPDNDMELSLDASIERLRSRLEDQKKRKRRGEEKETSTGYPKRRLRDVSPTSSIEHLTERRLKEERASASGDEKRGKKVPRWRKRYLIAGLFSDYYKEHE